MCTSHLAFIQFSDWTYPPLAIATLDVTAANGHIQINSNNSLKEVVMRRTDKNTSF